VREREREKQSNKNGQCVHDRSRSERMKKKRGTTGVIHLSIYTNVCVCVTSVDLLQKRKSDGKEGREREGEREEGVKIALKKNLEKIDSIFYGVFKILYLLRGV